MLKKLVIPLATAMLLLPNISNASEEVRPNNIPELGVLDQIPADNIADVTVTPIGGKIISPMISDPDGWQSRGKYSGHIYVGNKYSFIPATAGTNWISNGGDFQVRITGVDPANSYTVALMEYDPDDNGYNEDEKVWEGRLTGNNDVTFRGISQYVDGTNNEAEFYISITQGYVEDDIYAEGFD